ncbi:XdhC family protein [Burkholderia sp. BCC1977]|uniref:XdhC family protein n=1 Tax=Burkholderia sp. BCC1977 TaxID=2817440 RepID=UPI002ABD7642|nr:XdhC family protein [Burkholderia sp. BCC1977]
MDNVDVEVLETANKWLADGSEVLLITVVKTWGSSPRPEGALLAIRGDGCPVGSVSGGCIEDDLIAKIRDGSLYLESPEVVTYGVSAEEARRFGLPCGGTMQLVLEPLGARSRIDELCLRLRDGELVKRTVCLASGSTSLDTASLTDGVAIAAGEFTAIHGPRYRMLVIGAGQLSRYLSVISVGLGYQVTVCDPRLEYEDWSEPGVRIVRSMPDDAVVEMRMDRRCAVIALTHDPKLDDLALIEALKSDAFYVGAIGSRSNNSRRRLRLREFALSDEEIARLRGPIGLYIGSRTPPEIAISILAEVIAEKNNVSTPPGLRIEEAKSLLETGAAARGDQNNDD